MAALVCQCCGPRWVAAEDFVAHQHGRCGQMGRRVSHHVQFHQGQLYGVLRHLPCKLVTAVSSVQYFKEVRHIWAGHVEAKSGEHLAFHDENVFLGVSTVCDVHEVVHIRGSHFLELRSNTHGDYPNQLQATTHYRHPCQIPINEADCQEKCLYAQLVFLVHLNKPIHQDGTHFAIDISLRLHVVCLGDVKHLVLEHLAIDLCRVLLHLLWI
mmetsp:Transcript_343/g.682  ORF Transcript_343/g.682 Transcript_343/m.682 type:complete len:212 (+) Transcript_343:265-900(+)